jgi:hypothetical protein
MSLLGVDKSGRLTIVSYMIYLIQISSVNYLQCLQWSTLWLTCILSCYLTAVMCVQGASCCWSHMFRRVFIGYLTLLIPVSCIQSQVEFQVLNNVQYILSTTIIITAHTGVWSICMYCYTVLPYKLFIWLMERKYAVLVSKILLVCEGKCCCI